MKLPGCFVPVKAFFDSTLSNSLSKLNKNAQDKQNFLQNLFRSILFLIDCPVLYHRSSFLA